MVDPNGKWSVWVHNQIIDKVFKAFGLDEVERRVLKAASVHVDGDRDPSGSFKHGMTAHGHSPEGDWNLGTLFINLNMDAAVNAQLAWEKKQAESGLTPEQANESLEALFFFGQALHTVTDRPAQYHQGQVWGGLSPMYWDRSARHVAGEIALTSERFRQRSEGGETTLAESEYQAQVLWTTYQARLKAARKKAASEPPKEKQ